mmetsp:Transcript_18180/g.63887  ORF Transcript_18180/g.63887 Transcript_18180/m.63887 type:complete len:778 (+) Transcript_18180:179-2512(+)
MPSIGSLILFLIFLYVAANTGVNLYKTFHAPRCPEDAPPGECFEPLFEPLEEVDVYVFLTAKKKLRWWTEAGLDELRLLPLWNATGLKFGEPFSPNNTISLPLSAPLLAGVRRNETTLHAHCFLVRAGKRLEDAIREESQTTDPGPPTGTLGIDVVHATGMLTKFMPLTRRPDRRSLLTNLSAAEVAEDPDAPIRKPAVQVDLPGLGLVSLYPNDAFMWAGAVFSIGGFFVPGPVAAVVRGFVGVILVPWLLTLRQTQEAQYRALLRRRAKTEHEHRLMEEVKIVPHLVPVVRLVVGADAESYDGRLLPPLLYREMVFEGKSPMPVGERDIRYKLVGRRGKTQRYVPPLAIEHFGLRSQTWRFLDSNASRPDPELPIELDITGMNRYSVIEMMKQSLKMYMRVGFTERDLEELKDFFFRYPLHILIIMQVIGVVQMLLTTLAFKNDISFFRGRADYTGLSSRTLATDTLQELIIFLYLFDFEDISRLVLFQVGMSCVVGGWKYVRVARLQILWSYCLPWVTQNRGRKEIENSQEEYTEEIDARGMRYLKFVLYPLSAAWGVYNLYHYSYKSWWSWLVSSMADFAYTFGFINMMPQIFINYKMKSVAHMPWRVLMYKFFHTFIDDVFAFFIMSDYMTKKHRFMTLRDDIIFFVFLYQRYIYRVDQSRPDEYGFVYADAPTEKSEITAGDGSKEASESVANGTEKSEVAEDEAKATVDADGQEDEDESKVEDMEEEAADQKEGAQSQPRRRKKTEVSGGDTSVEKGAKDAEKTAAKEKK